MNFLSVASGIEAASCAWEPLGWRAVGFSDIDPFACDFLAERFPSVRNFGDMTDYAKWTLPRSPELLVGGTPCQSFSVAGLRAGLADPRGNLALVYLGIAARYCPRWIVWENVAGVLSSGGGRDFAAFIGALGKLGYGFAYRVLDAQFFGVPQRRRRVFVVGYLGDWRRAAAVLFEPQSMRGRPIARRPSAEEVAGTLTRSTGRRGGAQEADSGLLIASNGEGATGLPFLTRSNLGKTVNNQTPLLAYAPALAPCLMASKNRTGGHRPPGTAPEDCHGLIAFNARQDPCSGSIAGALGSQRPQSEAVVIRERDGYSVRRFTPLECERLQGFPDNWTAIDRKGKPASDAVRYSALGNSMARNVMEWIGARIAAVDALNLEKLQCP